MGVLTTRSGVSSMQNRNLIATYEQHSVSHFSLNLSISLNLADKAKRHLVSLIGALVNSRRPSREVLALQEYVQEVFGMKE